MPRKARSLIDTSDVQAGINPHMAPPELRPDFQTGDIVTVSPLQMRTLAEEEVFMNELITIEIEQDPDPDSPVFVSSGHNGIPQWIQRGVPQTMKRKFFYSLMCAKQVAIACNFGRTLTGEYNSLNPTAATVYRTRLIEDRNPAGGQKWVQDVMSQPS